MATELDCCGERELQCGHAESGVEDQYRCKKGTHLFSEDKKE